MVLIADGFERLDKFLSRSLPEHSRSKLTKMIDAGEVWVEGKGERSSFMLRPGTHVELSEPRETEAHDLTPADIPLEVVFEDEWMLVVNKPRGLASHPAASLKEPSLVNALLARNHSLSSVGGDFRPGIVHRLDKETSGLMVVAKTDAAHVALARQIEAKEAQRRYFALVTGVPATDRFVVEAPIGRNPNNRLLMAIRNDGKHALTRFKKISMSEAGTVIGAKLETGRTHQIRVHLSAVGFPVIGDKLYSQGHNREVPLQLHAAYLELNHPGSGELMSFFCRPDEQFLVHEPLTRDQIDPF
jgi:23S rRNA pseudouridine1911/1915/1917 synthase